MIGVSDVSRRTTTFKITPGTLLGMYTDGLVERRQYPIDRGLARLCSSIPVAPPEEACASVMAELIGSEQARDDIALLIFRRTHPA